MSAAKPVLLVTGISGNLGRRLALQLPDFDIVGVDFAPPPHDSTLKYFASVDLGTEASCRELVHLLRDTGATAVVHLAFVIDPVKTGILDVERMWHINVAGTARVMEAITEVNRHGGDVSKFIFPSSVSAYGPELERPATEESRLMAHTLPYAIHKKESDEVVQHRAERLGQCSTYILRPHIFAGASVENYLIGVLRGTPTGKGKRAAKWRAEGKRLPLVLPRGGEYPLKRVQFVHIDDMARLIAWILRRPENRASRTTILNVAGRGESITVAEAAEIANARIRRVPTRALCRAVLRLMWNRGISGVPPEALPYMIGSYTMDTTRLRTMLGSDYERVIQYTVRDALADSFASPQTMANTAAPAATSSP